MKGMRISGAKRTRIQSLVRTRSAALPAPTARLSIQRRGRCDATATCTRKSDTNPRSATQLLSRDLHMIHPFMSVKGGNSMLR